jgi:4-hydroxybenzoate polyprenyltransferase
MFLPLLKALRPHQWIKNMIIFAPLLFSQNIFNLNMLFKTLEGFFLFCMLCGGVYLINDLLDLEEDRKHPVKKNRPLASGQLSPKLAIITATLLTILSLTLAFLLSKPFGLIALIYIGFNLAYSRSLKHIVIIDVMVVALGFVLRALAGGYLIEVEISAWLIVCTTLLALLLSFGKRRHELVILEDQASHHRRTLDEYDPYLLDQMIAIVTASTVVAYALYTMAPEVEAKLQTSHLNLTIPFVLYGIFRYLFLVHKKEKGGNPTQLLLTDRPLLINVGLWLLTIVIILYC